MSDIERKLIQKLARAISHAARNVERTTLDEIDMTNNQLIAEIEEIQTAANHLNAILYPRAFDGRGEQFYK